MSEDLAYWKERCLQTEAVLHDVLEEKGLPTLAIGQKVWYLSRYPFENYRPYPAYVISSDGRKAVVAESLPENYPTYYQPERPNPFVISQTNLFTTLEAAQAKAAERAKQPEEYP